MCVAVTKLCIDNQSAIRLVKIQFHKRTKHIDIRYHYIREKTESKDISVQYVPSEILRADILTRAQPKRRFEELRPSLSMSEV